MNRNKTGNTVFDTGVLLELAAASPLSDALKEDIIEGSVPPATGELNLLELRYIFCRRIGR